MRNNKRRTKKISVLFLFSLILSLCSCSLAVENGDGQQTRDRLIGGLVTREYIGTEKIYATYEAWIGKGTPQEYKYGVEFEGIDGDFFYYSEKEDENGESTFAFHNGGGFKVDDGETASSVVIEMSKNIYFMPDKNADIEILYLNPVYETPEGEFYVVSGVSASMGEGMEKQGTSCNLSLKEEDKIILGNDSILERVEISAEFIVAYEPVKIWLSQMDENDNVIKKEEYLPDEIPMEPAVESETEYILVETEVMIPDGTTAIQREICEWDGRMSTVSVNNVEYERKEDILWTYSSGGNGFLTKKPVYFIWP